MRRQSRECRRRTLAQVFAVALALTLGQIVLANTTAAQAAESLPPCSASTPAQLTFDPEASRGLDENRIQLVHGEQSKQKAVYAFKVSGCDAGNLQIVDTELRGLHDSRDSNVVLVAKDADQMSLEVDFGETTLPPGSYELTAVSKSTAAPLVHPVNLVVRNPSPVWPLLALIGCGIMGALVLALRAQKASTSSAKLGRYFAKPSNILILATGVGAMLVVTVPAWLAPDWFADGGQMWKLIGAQFGGMVALPTATTAATGAGAKIETSGA